MTRSKWKIPISSIIKTKEGEIKIERNSIIRPELEKKKIKIYNGKEWKEIEIKEKMIGVKAGTFIATRKTVKHKEIGKKLNIKKSKQKK